MPFNNSCATAATGLREWSSPLQVWWRDHLQSNQELHGILLLDFLWDLLACMLGYISLETFCVLQKCRMVPNLTWKLYEESVLSCPEGGGTYLDLGRATVTRQMQPENTHEHAFANVIFTKSHKGIPLSAVALSARLSCRCCDGTTSNPSKKFSITQFASLVERP